MRLKHSPHARIISFVFLFFIFSNGASENTVTIVNDCNFTVWPGLIVEEYYKYYMYPNITTGFELTKGTSRSLQFDDDFMSVIIWGRTGCAFNGSGRGTCAIGDCGSGEVECNGGTFTPPVTIAEFGYSFYSYDVSIKNGFNLPVTIEPTGGFPFCMKMGCVIDLNQRCPSDLKLLEGGGCKSACQAVPSQYTCCGTSGNETCNPTSYGRLFHLACPKAVTYEYNEHGNIVHHCESSDYTVRFCPPADRFSTIRLGEKIFVNNQLISIDGRFSMGFFGENYCYLGIWYTNDLQSRKVWVANPNKPIVSTSGNHSLSINSNTGNLIIIDGEERTLMNISTNVDSGPNPNVTATLEDTGNLRLINQNDKSVLWQSFDHPTNVLLPGMKLGYDITTRQNWTLTSWSSDEIPAAGAFTLSWEPIDETSQRLMIRQRGQPYWTSGNLRKNSFQYFKRLINEQLTSDYNDKERLFSYNIVDFVKEDVDFPLHMWTLTPEGRIDFGRTPDVDQTLEFCYGSDAYGCMESSIPWCRREDDRFIHRNGGFASHKTSNATDYNMTLSISDCFVKCESDCSCVGFSNSSTNGTGCIFWKGTNSFLDNPLNTSTWVYVIRSQNLNTGKNKTKMIFILIGTIIPLIFSSLVLLWCVKKKNHQEEEERLKRDEYLLELTSSESFKDVYPLERNGGKGNDLLIFSFASIMAATNNFSTENKLGQGGFGPVYKGQLSDGQEIAIKRLSRTSGQGLVEFKNELVLIAKLQHTNLVRVIGFCIHREEKMLIYEYMPNKSLDFFIFDENRKVELDWPKRFNIVEGIAQGLLYLHKYSRLRIIHRDLKANNILLDESMNPKISDFGMARMFKQNETEAMTNRVVGTFGYMSPEYITEGTFSIKSDIFSFGVLILEIVSGRKNSCFVHLDRTYNLIGYAWELWQHGNALELEDMTISNTCVVQHFLRTVHVALLCVQESPTDRPTTSDMISMLLNDTVQLPAPKKPAFFINRVKSESTSDEIKPKDCSSNDMTLSVMEGR